MILEYKGEFGKLMNLLLTVADKLTIDVGDSKTLEVTHFMSKKNHTIKISFEDIAFADISITPSNYYNIIMVSQYRPHEHGMITSHQDAAEDIIVDFLKNVFELYKEKTGLFSVGIKNAINRIELRTGNEITIIQTENVDNNELISAFHKTYKYGQAVGRKNNKRKASD